MRFTTARPLTGRLATAVAVMALAATPSLVAAPSAQAEGIVYPASVNDSFYSTPDDIADRSPVTSSPRASFRRRSDFPAPTPSS